MPWKSSSVEDTINWLISIKFDVSAWESLPFNSRVRYLLIMCALASLCLWFSLSVYMYVCMYVCVCALFAGFRLSCDGQNNGSAMQTRADNLGDQIISLHTSPMSASLLCSRPESSFSCSIRRLVKLLVYPTLGPFSSIQTYSVSHVSAWWYYRVRFFAHSALRVFNFMLNRIFVIPDYTIWLKSF